MTGQNCPRSPIRQAGWAGAWSDRLHNRPDGGPTGVLAALAGQTGLPMLSGGLGIRAVDWHDVDPERQQGDRDDLEAADRERDTDDREREHDAGGQMPERQPPAEQEDPDHVPDYRGDPGPRAPVDRPAERPEHVAGDPEGGDPERDRDDQHE